MGGAASMIDVLRSDGSTMRVRGIMALAELVSDGLLGAEDRIGPGRRLDEVPELGWAFALADDGAPYKAYELEWAMTALPRDDRAPDSDFDAEPDDEDGEGDDRRAEQPETD